MDIIIIVISVFIMIIITWLMIVYRGEFRKNEQIWAKHRRNLTRRTTVRRSPDIVSDKKKI